MTEVKMPEPWAMAMASLGNGAYAVVGCTEDQLKQYGDDRAREALEMAAKLADSIVCDTHIPTGVKIYGTRAGKAIRALKDSIK